MEKKGKKVLETLQKHKTRYSGKPREKMAYSSAPYQDQPEFLDDPDSGGTSLIVPNGILTRDAAGRGKMSTPGVLYTSFSFLTTNLLFV